MEEFKTIIMGDWCNIKRIDDLNRGDIIKHKCGTITYVVDSVYGERATAINSKDITNIEEWEVFKKQQCAK